MASTPSGPWDEVLLVPEGGPAAAAGGVVLPQHLAAGAPQLQGGEAADRVQGQDAAIAGTVGVEVVHLRAHVLVEMHLHVEGIVSAW